MSERALRFDEHVRAGRGRGVEPLTLDDELDVQRQPGPTHAHRDPQIEGNVQRLNGDESLAAFLRRASKPAVRNVEQFDGVDDDIRMLLVEDAEQELGSIAL